VTPSPLRIMVLFTARKRRAWDGEPYDWTHGPFASVLEANAHAGKLRGKPGFAAKVRIEVVIGGQKGSGRIRSETTKAGLARAKASGKRLGRPRAKLDLARARRIIAAWTSVHGKAGGLVAAAKMLRVSVSTLKRAFRAVGQKGSPRTERKKAA
jgi:hypothetical protein